MQKVESNFEYTRVHEPEKLIGMSGNSIALPERECRIWFIEDRLRQYEIKCCMMCSLIRIFRCVGR